jgi:hypothetical protein
MRRFLPTPPPPPPPRSGSSRCCCCCCCFFSECSQRDVYIIPRIANHNNIIRKIIPSIGYLFPVIIIHDFVDLVVVVDNRPFLMVVLLDNHDRDSNVVLVLVLVLVEVENPNPFYITTTNNTLRETSILSKNENNNLKHSSSIA